jgi:uridine kinase
MVGIVDQALEAGGSDSLEIASYHEALVDFIKKTDTPMTIGVQGEWGSGKTSLLNQIWNRLEESNNEHDDDDENFLHFKNKRRNSNDFKEAVEAIQSFYDHKIKVIEL